MRMKRPVILVIIGWLLAFGVACGPPDTDQDTTSLLFVSELDKASICALALHSLETDQAEKTRHILEQNLIASLERANELGRSLHSLDLSIPNLRESIRKAEAYLTKEGLDPSSARELGRLIDSLHGASTTDAG